MNLRRLSPLVFLCSLASAQTGSIEGRVVNAITGEPVRKVQLLLRRGDPRPEPPLSTTSDSNGRFVFTGVEPARYRLWADKTGFVRSDFGARGAASPGAMIAVAAGQAVKDVTMKLTPQAVISGRVLDEDGEPMANVQVQVMRYQYLRGKRQLTPAGSDSTNDLGEYRIHSLPAGKYYIAARAWGMMQMLTSAAMGAGGGRVGISASRAGPPAEEGYVPTYYPRTNDPSQATPVSVAAGEVQRGLDLQLLRTRTVRVSGRVINNTRVAGRHIMIQLRARDFAGMVNPYSGTAPDTDGKFEIRGVAPGSYIITAALFADNVYYGARAPLDVGAGNVEDVQLQLAPGGQLHGVLRVEGDAPLAKGGIRVMLTPRAESLAFGGAPDPVKEDGSFTIRNVSAEEYNLSVVGLPEGFYVKSARLGDRDALLHGVDLTLGVTGALDVVISSKAAQLDGAVTNEEGQAVGGAQVVLVPEGERRNVTSLYKMATTDQNGLFFITGLAPGEYKVFAWEQVESGAWFDPEFIKPFESKGEKVSLSEGGRESRRMKAIE
jgi:protocatechuate 3,4-dioxygenase beta subunit